MKNNAIIISFFLILITCFDAKANQFYDNNYCQVLYQVAGDQRGVHKFLKKNHKLLKSIDEREISALVEESRDYAIENITALEIQMGMTDVEAAKFVLEYEERCKY